MLAADGLSTSNGLRDHLQAKIGKTENGRLWGLTGDAALTRPWMKWVETLTDPFDPKGAPDLSGESRDDSSTGILIMPDGRLFEMNGGDDILEYEPIMKVQAWGSGFRLAMGAMLAGQDALHAVETAALLDLHTGSPFMSFKLRD